MKTRMKLHLIIYTAFIAVLSSCENEIPYNPGQKEPQLILNALLDAGQAENYAYLHPVSYTHLTLPTICSV